MTTRLAQVLVDHPELVADLRYSAVAATNLIAGTPVAIHRGTGKLVEADAGSKPYAFVKGLLANDVLAGFVGSVALFQWRLADWSAITGTPLLAQGQVYFLRVGGGMSTIPPASGACVTVIGAALDQTTLQITPQSPIQT